MIVENVAASFTDDVGSSVLGHQIVALAVLACVLGLDPVGIGVYRRVADGKEVVVDEGVEVVQVEAALEVVEVVQLLKHAGSA